MIKKLPDGKSFIFESEKSYLIHKEKILEAFKKQLTFLRTQFTKNNEN